MKVVLTYFRASGKYYGDAEFESTKNSIVDGIGENDQSHPPLFHVWAEVQEMRDTGRLPGLILNSGKDFIILISVPEHQHDHPRLVLP